MTIEDKHSRLEQFVSDSLSLLGAVMDQVDYSLWEVILPEEMQKKSSSMIMTFDAEVAQERPDAIFVTHGSELLDQLVQHILDRYPMLVLYYPQNSISVPANFDTTLQQQFHFIKCRKPEIVDQHPVLMKDALFMFRAEFESDLRVEEAMAVLIRGDGVFLPDIWDAYRKVLWTPNREESVCSIVPVEPGIGLSALYSVALPEIDRLIEHRQHVLRKESWSAYQNERQRMEEYYEATLEDIDKRIGHEEVQDKLDRLKSRKESVQMDKERRLAELEASYHITTDKRIDHVRLYYVPRVRIRLNLQHRQLQLHATVYFNLVTRRFDPMKCGHCGQPVYSVLWHDDKWIGSCCAS